MISSLNFTNITILLPPFQGRGKEISTGKKIQEKKGEKRKKISLWEKEINFPIRERKIRDSNDRGRKNNSTSIQNIFSCNILSVLRSIAWK